MQKGEAEEKIKEVGMSDKFRYWRRWEVRDGTRVRQVMRLGHRIEGGTHSYDCESLGSAPEHECSLNLML